MTGLLTPAQRDRAIRQAAVRATQAPSIHNTQPWRFVLGPGRLDLYADPSRQLQVLDPLRRQLLLSCGCALVNARVSLAAADLAVTVARFPDSSDPTLLARLTIDGTRGGEAGLAELSDAIDVRRTNRRRFDGAAVPTTILDSLTDAALAEGAEVLVITRDVDRLAVARLSQLADEIENADPAYRAELRAWTTDDTTRVDGVQAYAVPHVDGHAQDDVPLRDFDSSGRGELPALTRSSLAQSMLLLGSLDDTPMGWLRTGEALERVLLEIARHGYTSSPLTQLIEVARANVLLRQELRLLMHPHVLLRIGRAPTTPATRRRRLVDVISVSS